MNGVSSIVGNYAQNMTLVAGSAKSIGQGLTQKTFSYSPLGALINIVFNTAGQIVQAVVQKASSATSGGSSSSIVASSSMASSTST